MFFAAAVGRWWGFPSHPPILERIRRAHPRFLRDEYRATRHGTRSEVAVIDGAGNVVKNLRMAPSEAGATALAAVASVGQPGAAARRLRGAAARAGCRRGCARRCSRAEEAELAMFALALESEPQRARPS